MFFTLSFTIRCENHSDFFSNKQNLIIPQKLIHSELPDDYPKELDYLFQCNYELFHNAFVNKEYNSENAYEIQDEYFQENRHRYEKLPYLIWLTKHLYPSYFAEYRVLNSFYVKDLLNFDDKLDRIVKEKSYVYKENNQLSCSDIFLYSNPNDVVENGGLLHHIWLRVKVHESDEVIVEGTKGESILTSFSAVDIVEDFSNIFPYKQLKINLYLGGDDKVNIPHLMLQEGKEYLIPINWRFTHFFYRAESTDDYLYFMPRAWLRDALLIEQGHITIPKIFDSHSNKVNQHRFYKYFGARISYIEAKEIIQKAINDLREWGTGN